MTGWRVSIVAATMVAACLACDSKPTSGSSAADNQRVNAVPAKTNQGVSAQEVCDRYFEAQAAPGFEWPPLAGAARPGRGGGWTWVNVWATWCKPCVEELPRLRAWETALKKEGLKVNLVLLSADEDDETVTAFAAKNEAARGSLRIADLKGWLESLVGKGASLPVHVFVDPSHRVRCVRASAVEDSELDRVRALLKAN